MIATLLRELRRPVSIELRESIVERYGRAFDKGCRAAKMIPPYDKALNSNEYYHFRNGFLYSRKKSWQKSCK